MKKYDKKDYINLAILVIFFLVFITILILCTKNSIYGSKLDYVDQHYMIPEYFRTLFYSSKKLFPTFALNLGMGQNIYNFSYYGLYSPIILLSYLLPFIRMSTYIQITSIVCIIIDIILFYRYISNHYENKLIRFISTFILLTSASLVLHSHRHIMFINYMPFLILGFIAIDNYFNKNKKTLLMISIILIILTSYFFSVSSLISLILYAIFIYLKNNEFKFKDFINTFLKLSIYFIIPIMISAILLFPTLSAILSNRLDNNITTLFTNLILPNLSFEYLLYSCYSLGLTSSFILAIANGLLSKQKEYKFLSITFIILGFFPIFIYILNGGMYINAKVLIPMIPLAIILLSKLFSDIISKNIRLIPLLVMTIILSLIGSINFNFDRVYLIDITFLLLCLVLTIKRKSKVVFFMIILMSTVNLFFVNVIDKLETRDQIENQYNENIKKLIPKNTNLEKTHVEIKENINDTNNIRDINEMKTTMYSSLTNKFYNNFYWNEINNNNPYRNSTIISGTDNIFYNIYTNTKNYITENNAPIGYKLIKEEKNYKLYQNSDIFSTIYANSNLMSLNEYKKLSYPYSTESLLNYTIVNDNNITSNYKTNIKEINYSEEKIPFVKRNNKYSFKLDKQMKYTIPLENNYKNKILMISFDMDYSQKCSLGDTYIIINGVKNTLTCKSWKYHNQNYTFDYVLSSNNINSLDITISKGQFVIKNIKAYEIDYNNLKNINKTHDNLNITSIKENQINGTINVTRDSYLNINIPYDKGFEIYIDNIKQDYELINTAFMGTKISKGIHEVKIIYNSPMLKQSKIISLIGVILFTITIVIDKIKKKEGKI